MSAIDEGGSLGALEERSGEDLWQRVFDAVEDAIFIQNASGIILRANQAAGALSGLSAEALVGRRCYEVVHGTASFIEGCPFVRSWASRRRESYTLFMHDRWYRVTVDPLLDAEKNVVGAVHLITDLSEIKRIDELRSHLAAILETSEDAIVATALDGRILSMNASAERLFCFDGAESRQVTDFVPETRKDEWNAAISRVIGGDAGKRFESEIVVGGERLEISVGISRVLDERGVVGGISFMIHDLSAQRRAERALVAYVTEASLRMKVPLGAVSEEVDRVTALLARGAITPLEAVAILKVQKTHLDQIARNLADLDRAVASSDGEIPEAYRRFFAGE
ncbi:MAG TPA: PAS domain S-box protein [Methanofollis liminatans]|uniref:PAS domain S-box protein n=1 Tax=Methanofollis liminatans TaxID=2201 RepID=A0A831LY67_9EURY|nr:PAS domain S-box protein [Methanofollis liminatans]